MAYKTEDLEKKAIEAIELYNLVYIEEVVHYLPCDKVTFYNHKLNEFNSIKDRLEKNKVDIKGELRKKMFDSESPSDRVILYKLLSTDDELQRLNSSTVKASHDGTISIQQLEPAKFAIDDGNRTDAPEAD